MSFQPGRHERPRGSVARSRSPIARLCIVALLVCVGGSNVSIMGGAWVETGSAFNEWSDASISAQVAVGAIVETLIGPAVVRYSAGAGARRFAIGFGRLF